MRLSVYLVAMVSVAGAWYKQNGHSITGGTSPNICGGRGPARNEKNGPNQIQDFVKRSGQKTMKKGIKKIENQGEI